MYIVYTAVSKLFNARP